MVLCATSCRFPVRLLGTISSFLEEIWNSRWVPPRDRRSSRKFLYRRWHSLHSPAGFAKLWYVITILLSGKQIWGWHLRFLWGVLVSTQNSAMSLWFQLWKLEPERHRLCLLVRPLINEIGSKKAGSWISSFLQQGGLHTYTSISKSNIYAPKPICWQIIEVYTKADPKRGISNRKRQVSGKKLSLCAVVSTYRDTADQVFSLCSHPMFYDTK